MDKPLQGKIALVAGATRGAGRGIAVELGAAGATVYCTGRSTRQAGATPGRPETIEETAEMISARGGVGLWARVDHTVPAEVQALIERIRQEQGRLDLLVNDVWGGDALTTWDVPFWEHPLEPGLTMQVRAVHSHIITAWYAAPLMVEQQQGLIIEVTDGVTPDYRGSLFYDLAKASAIRLAVAMAADLRPYNVAALALTPGFLRSEAVLEILGVTEANWREGANKEPGFIASETPFYIGRAVAALAAEPQIMQRSGQGYVTGDLAVEYGFYDVDGTQPNWARWWAENRDKLE